MPAAKQAASRGARVCLIEQNVLGGVCLNVGCMPTKAMLHAAEVFYEAGRMHELGFTPVMPRVEPGRFMLRVHHIVKQLLDDAYRGLEQYETITLFEGRGRLISEHELAVEPDHQDDVRIQADAIVIATGSSPVMPDFLPWESGRVMTTNEALSAQSLPESVLIMGAGVIGCEFACLYSELGIEVTLVEMKESILSLLECDCISREVHGQLESRGVQICTGTKVRGMAADESGITTKLSSGQSVRSAYALVSVGRQANVAKIGLENAGVTVEEGIIAVDEQCRTNVSHIFAAGDVAETRQYTHLANRMGLIAGDNAAGHANADDRGVVPIGIYTHPNVALVGLTEIQARRMYEDIEVFEAEYARSGTAIAYGQTRGLVRVVVQGLTGKLLGAVWIGPRATDMIHETALALRQGLTVKDVMDTIHAHPTFSEIITDALSPWMKKYAISAGHTEQAGPAG